MDADALVRWKSDLFAHQQRARTSEPTQQMALFELAPTHCDPDVIDPFALHLHPMSFYRLPVDSPGQACIYFVLDCAANLVLYVGETCQSNKRWKGTHDCKRYIELYRDLHYRYKLDTAINMSFWWDAPTQTRPRQQLESALIAKWKSPFNKQNWELWGRPFG
jgi:hypothetical protein